MLTETDLDYILSTFEISEKVSRKVRYIVDSELKEVGFPHFDLLYRRIADLVEVYAHGHYEERFMVRLDQKKSPDDNRTLHDLLGRNDENFIQIEGDDSSSTEDHRGRISLGDAVDMLFGELPPEEAELLRQLSKNSSEEDLFLSEQEVLGFVPKVREGLHKLLHEYGKDGRLLIPRRPIVEVKWDPNLRVKFGRRDFNGSPLQFFLDNIEVTYNINFEKYINENDFDIIGIQMFTFDVSPVKTHLDIIKRLKPNTITVLGGYHPSGDPEGVLKSFPKADFAFVSEVEIAFSEFLKQLQKKKPNFTEVPNLNWRKNDKIITLCRITYLKKKNASFAELNGRKRQRKMPGIQSSKNMHCGEAECFFLLYYFLV